MRKTNIFIAIILTISCTCIKAQDQHSYSLAFGAGLFGPNLSHSNITYDNAEFSPNIGPGISYFASFDYSVSEDFMVGIGFNGALAKADFIKDALVNDEQLIGYLDAGAIANTHFLLNLTYSPTGEGIKPFTRLGLGYFIEQAELGDVPLRLTDNVETEIFTDFKYSGFGLLPELGARYQSYTLSAGYSVALGELTGEKVKEGYQSPGEMTLQGLQINFAYRISLF
jgi:hypothetical protein